MYLVVAFMVQITDLIIFSFYLSYEAILCSCWQINEPMWPHTVLVAVECIYFLAWAWCFKYFKCCNS